MAMAGTRAARTIFIVVCAASSSMGSCAFVCRRPQTQHDCLLFVGLFRNFHAVSTATLLNAVLKQQLRL